MVEELKDIEGAVHMIHEHGDRFLGWYLFKKPSRRQSYPLNYKNKKLEYLFTVLEYSVKFIMPAKLEFNTGMIAYNRGERELGVFRYPRDEKGLFVAPYPLKNLDDFRKLDPEDMKKLLNRKEPLVFEAYKIPQYGFEIIDVNNLNIKEIANITDIDFAMSIKGEHDRLVGAALEETKQKINSSPNYLLILINVLNCHWKNLEEVACATNRIIHI